ncbi:hypothetical protein BDQ12DRAFT_717263 [Crucibulum laeve]|uniref:F-box domain-containing protein n=1 Tax=Crucibulum laeve TaxID=68775 RepID=A0A5C3MHD4_9AGAR|nr:hypothetical protein BDQ12DRAFT_717263 [Crucibulum laeve]
MNSPAPFFPQELFDRIINVCDDPDSLKAFALVRRAWRHPAQSTFFYSITTTNSKQFAKLYLFLFLGIAERVQHYIHELRLTISFIAGWHAQSDNVGHILRLLGKQLHSLHLDGIRKSGYSPWDLTFIGIDLYSDIIEILRSPSLTSFGLTGWHIQANSSWPGSGFVAFNKLFTNARSLKHLELEVEVASPLVTESMVASRAVPISHAGTIRLESLSLRMNAAQENPDNITQWLCHPCCALDVSQLQRLDVRALDHPRQLFELLPLTEGTLQVLNLTLLGCIVVIIPIVETHFL